MDIKTVTDAVETFQVPTKEVSSNLTIKPSEEIGNGLSDIFWLVFAPFQLARAAWEPRIQGYRKRIEDKVAKIPEDRLVEPPLNIVGPALEASKYYIEDEEIREMFANLIASSMDSNTQISAHPAFVEIIRQLSPFDAEILKYLNLHDGLIGVGTIVGDYHTEKLTMNSTILFTKFIPFLEMNMDNSHQFQSSINNLERLGLIFIDDTKFFMDDARYTELYEHSVFQHYKENKHTFKLENGKSISTVRINHGSWGFTSFGEKFKNCCF